MKYIKIVINFIVMRVLMVLVGIIVIIFGLISPETTISILKNASLNTEV